MKSEELSLKYFTFAFAVVINVVLILNMIISILGDSFDEFQLKSEVFDYKEMAEIVVEVEQIKSILKPLNVYQYLNVCVHAYESNATNWKGKIPDTRLQIQNCQKAIMNKIESNGKFVKKNLENRISKVEDMIINVDSQINSIENSFDRKTENIAKIENNIKKYQEELQGKIEENIIAKIATVENDIKNIDGNMRESVKNLESSIKTIDSNVIDTMNKFDNRMLSIENSLESIMKILSKENSS